MPRIVFMNRFFFPDHSATSQILSDLAFSLADAGRDVCVITSRQLYDTPGARLTAGETIRGVRVTRVATTEFGRSSLTGRAADYASSYAAMARAAAAITSPGDILIAKTDPPLLSVVGAKVASRRGATLVNWLQDLYPDVAAATGVPMTRGLLGSILTRLRDHSLRYARVNVTIGTAMATRLERQCIASDAVRIIPNWADDKNIVPLPPAANPLRDTWQLDGKFVVGYSGNLGRTHDVEPLLAAAEQLRHRADIAFVFIGGGTQFDALRTRIDGAGLGGAIRFFPYQDREALPLSLTLPDVHWLSLRPSLEGVVFPSKFYGIAAAGRPMLALTAPDGELAGLVGRHRCGLLVTPGDTSGVVRAILHLAAEAGDREAMGGRARAMLDAHFSRAEALRRWHELLDTPMG